MGPAVHDMDSNPEYGVPPTYGSCSARFEFSRGSNVDSGRWKEKKNISANENHSEILCRHEKSAKENKIMTICKQLFGGKFMMFTSNYDY